MTSVNLRSNRKRRPFYRPSVTHFAIPMGVMGLSINAAHLLEQFDQPLWWIHGLYHYAWLMLCVLLVVGFKYAITRRRRLLAELRHPEYASFLPSITLTTNLALLGYTILFPSAAQVADIIARLFIMVMVLHGYLNLYLLTRWFFKRDLSIHQHLPSWYILLSGNFVVSIVGMQLLPVDTVPAWFEILWMFFAIALFLWFSFTISLLYRLIFEAPMAKQLKPSLFIFLAPPSLGVLASISLFSEFNAPVMSGEMAINLLTWLLFSFASLMLVVWMVSFRQFLESGLSIAAWAYVYPLSAYGLACQYLSNVLQWQWMMVFGVFVFIVTCTIVLLLSYDLLQTAINRLRISR